MRLYWALSCNEYLDNRSNGYFLAFEALHREAGMPLAFEYYVKPQLLTVLLLDSVSFFACLYSKIAQKTISRIYIQFSQKGGSRSNIGLSQLRNNPQLILDPG